MLELPLAMAAQLAALQDLHKGKSAHQIVIDLISLGLDQIEAVARRSPKLSETMQDAGQIAVYLLNGPFAEFHHLVVKHHRRMEREAAGDDMEPGAARDPYDLNDDAT